MQHYSGKVEFKSVAGNSKQREGAIDAAHSAFVYLTPGMAQTAVKRVNLYQEVIANGPSRVDVEGATYVGEQGTLAVRHYRTWHKDKQRYHGKLEFDLFMENAKTCDLVRKGILKCVRDVRKRS
jgi:hypothetical protein